MSKIGCFFINVINPDNDNYQEDTFFTPNALNSFKKWRVVRYTEGEESTLESDILNKESDLDKVTTYQADINKKEQKILQFERLKEDAKPRIPVADVKQEIKKEQKVSFLETESIPKVKTKKSSKKRSFR
jgi:hypothetical protein